MSRLVFILGLGHSGSTLLDLMLSGHPQIVGIGEGRMVTRPRDRSRRLDAAETKVCSCGLPMADCPLWSRYLQRMAADADCDQTAAYRHLLAAHGECAAAAPSDLESGGPLLSDSSKELGTLEVLASLLGDGSLDDLRVIHLVRDARSFAISERNRGLKTGQRSGASLVVRAMRLWLKQNRRDVGRIGDLGLPTLNVGYEELCFFPEATMAAVADFLDVPPDRGMLAPCPTGGHVATGNPMRLDPQKSSRLTYDHRWFFSPAASAAYHMLPGVRRLNERLVYPRSRAGDGSDSFRPPTAVGFGKPAPQDATQNPTQIDTQDTPPQAAGILTAP